MCVCILCVCLVPAEVRRRYQIPWNWSHGQLGGATWVLGTKPEAFVRAASPSQHWSISPAPAQILKRDTCTLLFSYWTSETMEPKELEFLQKFLTCEDKIEASY